MITFKKGEVFMKRLNISLILIVFLLTIGGICLAQQIIPWDKADKYYGQNVTVEGTIVATHKSEKACFLNFHQDWKTHFAAVIFKSDFSKFPPNSETYYRGKKVHVTGVVEEFNDKPRIILKSPSQIKIVE
jgi:DNA/RNA endonuclease YhcR with UshA esterase domain